MVKVVALPGLDGTGALLVPFAEASGARIVSYPPDRELTFDEYVAIAARDVDRDTILVAESFSGPVAVRIAANQQVRALVLVASFVTPPLPRVLRALPLATLARLQVPDWLLSYWMLSPYATKERVREFRAAIGAVAPRVLASRMRIALSVDERESLKRVTAPVLNLRGTRDRLVFARPPAGELAWLEAPHAVLYTQPLQAWNTIAGWMAK